jgi:hypothetical protein
MVLEEGAGLGYRVATAGSRRPRAIEGSNSSEFEAKKDDLHRVLLEEILEFPLRGRIGEIPNVQPTTLGSTGDHRIVLSSVGIASVSSAGRVRDAGRSQGIGEIVNGSRHVEG